MKFPIAVGHPKRTVVRTISVLSIASITAIGTYVATPATTAGASATPTGQLTVTVFQDFNANGTRNIAKDAANPAFDAKVAGATVRAICVTDSGTDGTVGTADDTQSTVTSITQDVAGDYVLAAPGSPCRVEVVGGGLYQDGASGATSVTFVDTVPSTVLVGINRPYDYCQDNPDIFVTCFNRHSSNLPTGRSVKTFPWTTMSDPDGNPSATWTGNVAGPDPLADNAGVVTTYATTGSTFGIAADVDNNRLFQSAYFKGGSAFGPDGTGAIYATDLLTNTTTLYADLNAIFGAGTAGTNTHNFASAGAANLDSAAKRDVGKISLGDMELTQDGTKLYVSNLFDKQVYVIPTTGTVDSTTVTVLATPAVPADCAVLTDLVTMGLGEDANGDMYLGGVCTGESTASNSNIHSYVWKLDTAGTWTLVYTGPMPDDDTVYTPANPGLAAITQARYWRNGSACSIGFFGLTCPSQTVPPQYMLADIAFDGDNAMILGYRDRQNDMYTAEEASFGSVLPAGSVNQQATLNRLCRASSSAAWTLESGMSCGGVTTGPEVPAVNPGNDPTGDEYYWSDRQGDGGWESGEGGIVQIPGWPVINTTVDPQTMNSDGVFVNQNRGTGGVNAFDNATGAIRGSLDVMLSTSQGSFAKLNSMGDVDAMCDRAPVEIGNRLWIDADSDGIQDPGEAPVAGVEVKLYEDADNNGVPDGAAIATATTDSAGNYIFSDDARFTDSTSKKYDIAALTFDSTDPTSNRFIIGVPTSVTVATTTYNLTDKGTTIASDPDNAPGTANTWVDSDVITTTGYTSTFTTQTSGINVHTYDAGYKLSTPKVGVGNLVWEDADNNGIVNGTEAGISGVEVKIYLDANSDGIADGAALRTMNTDANGNYLFEGLEEGNYFITTAIPTGYVTSTGTNGADGPYETPAPDPDTNATNSDDNGSLNGAVVQSATFTLAKGTEPTGEPAMTLITPTLPDADVNQTVDFGFFHPVGVGNFVWIDTNNNGQWDTGELPYTTASLSIYEDFNNDGTPDGAAIATTTTDGDGHYAFNNLIPGTYIIEMAKPSGYVSSTGTNGSATGAYEGAATPDPDTTVNADTGSAGDDNGSTVGASVIRSKPITLTVGGETGDGDSNADFNPSVDFGIFRPAELGDLLWRDLDHDGQQDGGTEVGVPDVTVTLYDAATNAVVATTSTDANGKYLFTNLIPGSYYVIFDASDPQFPDQYAFTLDNVNPDGTDSDAGPLTGKTGNYTLAAGDSNLTVDAGIYAPGPVLSLGNLIWADYDNDGVVDPSEPGIGGVTVELFADTDSDGNPDGPALASQTTSLTGNYLFTGLAAGDYVVRIPQSNWDAGGALVRWHSSSPESADPDSDLNNDDNGVGAAYAETTASAVTLAFGAEPTNDGDVTANANSNLSVDFGFVPDLAELGDKVWFDTTRNGVQDPWEYPVFGMWVKLFRAGDDPATATPVQAMPTDSAGLYLFENLVPGEYFVVFDPATLPEGWSFTSKDAGSDDAFDSDADPVTGRAATTTLSAGESDRTWDAGVVTHASIGDYVWLDSNKNGIQDTGEPGFGNVTVKLVNADTGAVVATTTTDASGKYLFSDVNPITDMHIPINFRIEFVAPAGYSISPRNIGNDATDSDTDPASGRTASTTLGLLEDDRTWDMGLYLTPIDFTLNKTLDGQLVKDTVVSYLLDVTHKGPVDSTTQITVTDDLPAGLTFISASGDQWACAAAGQTVTCSRTTPMVVGSTSRITVQVLVVANAGTPVVNHAAVSLVNDADATNNESSVAITVGSATATTTTTSVGTTGTTSRPGGNLPATGTGIVRTVGMLGAAALFLGFISAQSARRTRRKVVG